MAYVELPSGTVLETDNPAIWPEAKKLSFAEGKRRLKDEALEYLRSIIKPGDTIHTNVTHVSRSGMSRNVQAFFIKDSDVQNISGYVARAIDHPCERRQLAVKMGGCGMDMGFALVYNLSSVLFRDNFICTGEKCPSNDHNNGEKDRTPHKHSDGGYALRHRQL